MTILGCQLDISWENKRKNYEKAGALLNQQKLSAGSLVVLPEMFATGFSMDAGKIAERAGGPTTDFMKQLAREKGVYVLGGLVRQDSVSRVFNEAICVAPSGRRVVRYDKLHLFRPGGESKHYAPGGDITLFQWGNFKVASFVCYDLRFPEIFRMATLRGAEVLVVIANWPRRRSIHWSLLLQARAIENQAYVVGVNRCGQDPQLDYSGGTVVIGPWGDTIASAGENETVISADLDRAVVTKCRRDFAVLRDVRTSFKLKNPGNKK